MKQFDNRYKIKRHVSIHAKVFIRWPCFRCGKVYSTERGLTAHKCDGKSKWSCVHCGKTYNTKKGLAAHKCDGKSKEKSKDYPRLDATHYEKTYPYWCEYCSKGVIGISDSRNVEVKCNNCYQPVSLKKTMPKPKRGKQKKTQKD